MKVIYILPQNITLNFLLGLDSGEEVKFKFISFDQAAAVSTMLLLASSMFELSWYQSITRNTAGY